MQGSIAKLHAVAPRSTGREVQDGIRRIEDSIDAMLADSAALVASSIRAGQEAGLAPAFGHKALERQVNLLNTAMTMRSLAFHAHQDMRNVLKRVDTEVVGWGDMGDSPKMAFAPDTVEG